MVSFEVNNLTRNGRAETSRVEPKVGGGSKRIPPLFFPNNQKVDAESHKFGHVIKVTLHTLLPRP